MKYSKRTAPTKKSLNAEVLCYEDSV